MLCESLDPGCYEIGLDNVCFRKTRTNSRIPQLNPPSSRDITGFVVGVYRDFCSPSSIDELGGESVIKLAPLHSSLILRNYWPGHPFFLFWLSFAIRIR